MKKQTNLKTPHFIFPMWFFSFLVPPTFVEKPQLFFSSEAMKLKRQEELLKASEVNRVEKNNKKTAKKGRTQEIATNFAL